MPRKIEILPSSVAQAIAAGEVVERPASVVKELIENALDAGASEVTVELKAGGLGVIRVLDNGEGMDPEDLPVALERYATSKIKRSEDLFAIQTLGFRGEALPSIAAVSQMRIKTRVFGSMSGAELFSEGGEVKSLMEVGCPVGTEVEVRNLFFNLPVKRKFVRSIQTELRHCLNHFLRLSLSHPSVCFRFVHEGRMLYEYLKSDSLGVRVEAVLGREIYEHLVALEFDEEEIHLRGFTSLPSFSKGKSEGVYLYVNRRFVKDRTIYKAILEAYRHQLPAGRFPVVVLFLNLPPAAIDVNVHPTKAEVKFRDPDRIFRIVTGVLSSSLGAPSSLMRGRGKEGETRERRSFGESFGEGLSESLGASYPSTKDDGVSSHLVREAGAPIWEVEKKVALRILGQVQATYILCEGEEGLILIDQHAAHERVLYDRYKKTHEGGSVPSETLLFPIPMELSTEESFLLMSHLEEFASLGFELDPIGERTVALRTIPKLVEPFDPKEIVRELLEEISFLKRDGRGADALRGMLVRLACHSAIKANVVLRREEMEELVQTLLPLRQSITCPHGRPVFFILSKEELAKQFRRKG